MSLIGKEINDFSVWAYQNKDFKKVTKEDIKGKWSVFFFYPADFTFVCPTELEDLQNRYDDFKKESCEIFTVSTDTHFVHKAWHDSSERISKTEFPSFIVDPDGKIVMYEVNAGNVGRNAEELFRRLQACKFVAEHGDEVCPAKWTPGEETLKPSLDLVGLL